MSDTLYSQILNFWFGERSSPDYGKPKVFWFKSTPEIDQNIREVFGNIYDRAVDGEFSEWLSAPDGCLSLVLLFDQFSRNMFRGQPQAFATDKKALEIAKEAIGKGFDQRLPAFQRPFLYMPFMHSEDIDDQNKCVELFKLLGNDVGLDYAKQHRDIIARFGRFPHRNVILNRESTKEELDFLKEPGSSF